MRYDEMSYFGRLKQLIDLLSEENIRNISKIIADAWQRDANVVVAGNGGSALSALHIATDLSKGVRAARGRGLRCLTPIDNLGLLTAYSNDVSYADAFAEQISDLGRSQDILLVLSVSGNSENVVRAINAARAKDMIIVGLLGMDGGRIRPLCHLALVVPSSDFQIVEDVHMSIGHMLAQRLMSEDHIKEAPR